jgi:hypothetical protein
MCAVARRLPVDPRRQLSPPGECRRGPHTERQLRRAAGNPRTAPAADAVTATTAQIESGVNSTPVAATASGPGRGATATGRRQLEAVTISTSPPPAPAQTAPSGHRQPDKSGLRCPRDDDCRSRLGGRRRSRKSPVAGTRAAPHHAGDRVGAELASHVDGPGRGRRRRSFHANPQASRAARRGGGASRQRARPLWTAQ